jgi:hypothetical protein
VCSSELPPIAWHRDQLYLENCISLWNSAFFDFSLIIEGTTEKALKFIMSLKSIYNRNFGFIEQKMYFWTLQWVSSKKNSINWHHFTTKKISVDIFRVAPYMIMLVLHKDALFHSQLSITPRPSELVLFSFNFSLQNSDVYKLNPFGQNINKN